MTPQGSRRKVRLQALDPAQLVGVRTGALIRVTGSFQAAPRGRRGSGGPFFLATRVDVLAGSPGGGASVQGPARRLAARPGGGSTPKAQPPFQVRQPLMLPELPVLWIPLLADRPDHPSVATCVDPKLAVPTFTTQELRQALFASPANPTGITLERQFQQCSFGEARQRGGGAPREGAQRARSLPASA